MSEKRIKNYEAKCLLMLLSAIVNEEEFPKWHQQPQWGEIYKLADYHGVANMVYYSVLGLDDKSIAPWKPKFEKRYHQAVLSAKRYSGAVPQLLEELEKHRIHCLTLFEYRVRSFYSQPDMRALKKVRLLVEKGKDKKLKEVMENLGYEEKESRIRGERMFYRIPGVHITLQTEFSFTNKKMERYYSIPIRHYENENDRKYIHKLLPEDFYMHVIGHAAESYARGNLSILEVMDLWLYYKKVYKILDWEQITKEIEFLKLEQFHLYLIRLAAYWFGEMIFPESDSVFDAMEQYILSKGMKGRRISAALLPLVKEVADFYEKDMKKKRREQRKTWIFPKREYMETMFPVLIKTRWLLPACWICRLCRLFAQRVWMHLRRGGDILKNNVSQLKKYMENSIQPYKETVTDFTDPKIESLKCKIRHFRQKGFAIIEGLHDRVHSWVQILKRILNIHP